MYKNQLQELAQRSCFNLPSYSCVREGPDHAPRFKATVNFNEETFESPNFCPTLRLAEHSAAEVALNTLANRDSSKRQAARVLDETGIYKNLLQETAHRAGLELPLYTTVRSGSGHSPVFSSTVELAGMCFSGEPSRTKKQAQKNAAMAAWTALRQLAQSRSLSSASTSSSPQIDGSDEQDQVIISRVLVSLQLSETDKPSPQIDHQQRSISTDSFQNPQPLSYSVQNERWAYSNFPTEIAMYHIWPQQQANLLELQTRIFPLSVSLNPPHMPSIFQEPVPIRPGFIIPTLSPTSYLPRGLFRSPIRGSSMVSIEEIGNETDGSENIGMSETQDRRTQLPLDSNGLNLIGHQRPLMHSSHLIGRPTSVGTLVPRPGLLLGPRNQNMRNRALVPMQMRKGANANLRGHRTDLGRVPSQFMVPAVQIRTIAPVCSAPPVTVRKVQSTSQIGQSTNQEVKANPGDNDDVSDASSGVDKLQI